MPRPLPRTFAGPLAGLALALAAACTRAPAPAAESAPAPRGCILISIDTLRADHLGAWGYSRDTSPRIDALATAGVRFAECFSPTSWTLPSHLSMLTGLAVSVHGIDDERHWNIAGRPGAPPTVPLRGTYLPEVFRSAGWRTAGFFSWKYLEPRFGFGAGFERYERVGRTVFDDARLKQRFDNLRLSDRHDDLRDWREREPQLFEMDQHQDDVVVDRGLAWIDELLDGQGADGPEPFFLFLHLFDPHDAYVPPAPFDSAFTDPAYDGPIDGREVTRLRRGGPAAIGPADLEYLVALYDGEIAWTDSQIGRLVDGLAERGLLDDVVLGLTSDHGEEFFEHGAITHRANVYRETTHVPWILHWPAGLAGGRVVPGAVGVVDIAPTLLGLAGLEPPSELTGRDLSTVAAGRAENVSTSYTSVVQLFHGDFSPDRHLVLRRDGVDFYQAWEDGERVQYALVERRGDTPTLVELAPDSDRARELEAELQAVREAYLRQRAAAVARNADGGRLTDDELAELQALGYAADGEVPAGERDEPAAEGAAGSYDLNRLALDGGIWQDR